MTTLTTITRTIKYSGAGVPLWTNRYDGRRGQHVFVTGRSEGIFHINATATVAYSSAGVPLRTNRYSVPGNSWSDARAIAVDKWGNVFVIGISSQLSAANQ